VRKILFGLVLGSLCTAQAVAQIYYVSPTGSDTYPGTFDSSFATITKAVSVATPGTTIYLRGGTYALASTISISKSGTASDTYNLLAYPGERPLLDFSAMPVSSSNRGINLSGSYWYIKALDIYRAGDNGMHITGSNNVIEFCSFAENSDTGLQLDGGASNNQIINCDSYYNMDPGQGNADGFAPKLTVGSGNYFYGCRAWQNSDDGWDGYLRGANNVTTTIENCWCFANGYLKTGGPSTGNGNGYKLGGSDNKDLQHDMILKNCLAFANRVKGYDQNNNRGSMVLYNCSAHMNGTNYSISQTLAAEESLVVKNCLVLGYFGSIGSFGVQQTNSWMGFVVSNEDFVSIDTVGLRAPRNVDGSLPDTQYMHLAQGSDLIDAGTDVGLPFNGSAPDLGCFEVKGATSVGPLRTVASMFRLEQNYPNPFNPETTIRYAIPVEKYNYTSLRVYDLLGREVAVLVDAWQAPGSYSVTFDARGLASGVYLYRLAIGGNVDVKRLTLLR
jgi:hypothetical protein